MAKVKLPTSHPIYTAFERFVSAALQQDDSLFVPGTPIWSLTTINALYAAFVEHPNTSQLGFLDKFKIQLANADDQTILLAAELLYMHLLPLNGVKAATKRSQVRTVLSWAKNPLTSTIPAELDRALDMGIAQAGVAMMTGKPFQLGFLLEFVRRWKQLPPEQRSQALSDPWAFRQFLFSIPIKFAFGQRELLLHIVHPNTFEATMSRDHKHMIAKTFAHLVDNSAANIDQQLLQIRTNLEPRYGQGFNVYEDRIKALWQSPKHPPDPLRLPHSIGPQLRPYVELARHLGTQSYTAKEIVDQLGRIRPPLANLTSAPDAEQLAQDLRMLRLMQRTDDGRYQRWEHLSDGTTEHMLRYAALTLLIPDNEDYLLPALIAPFNEPPQPAAAWPLQGAILPWYAEAKLVEQTAEGAWQARADALDPLAAETPTARTLNRFLTNLQHAREPQPELPPLDNRPLSQLPSELLEERIREIQRELLVERSCILRIYRSLIAGQHVILSGPPGTGKTHLARMLPRILWRDTVQTTVTSMLNDPDEPPDAEAESDAKISSREGYLAEVVTATEDWGVRHLVGGISPQLQQHDQQKTLVYAIQHGHLTRTVLRNYQGYDGETIPALDLPQRTELADAQYSYRGIWLVIDEFTRAQVDAAFGGLLTTLGGQTPLLAVPIENGSERSIPLPPDFRLIGTLNSFDRHFLNQMSEAMKRRFAFIDILPPGRDYAEAEQGMAMFHALKRLHSAGIGSITAIDTEDAASAELPGVLHIERIDTGEKAQLPLRYQIQFDDQEAAAILRSFWQLFTAIRIYRQLGTAQAEAVYTAIFTGICIGMSWSEALDSALADTLADQLQVLARDEQRVLLALLDSAADSSAFTKRVKEILTNLPSQRQIVHLSQLSAAAHPKRAPIDELQLESLQEEQIAYLFTIDPTLAARIPTDGLFAKRLRAFIHERGL